MYSEITQNWVVVFCDVSHANFSQVDSEWLMWELKYFQNLVISACFQHCSWKTNQTSFESIHSNEPNEQILSQITKQEKIDDETSLLTWFLNY